MITPRTSCLVALAFGMSLVCIPLQPVSGKPQNAQTSRGDRASSTEDGNAPPQYTVTLSEYHLEEFDPSRLTSTQVIDAINSKKLSPEQTIILTAVAGTESVVQFGRTVTVATGQIKNQNFTTRQTEQRDVGAVLRVIARPEGQSVSATVSYEASRHVGEGTEDSPPDLVTTSINTTQLFEIGQQSLLAGTTAGETSYVIVTINRR